MDFKAVHNEFSNFTDWDVKLEKLLNFLKKSTIHDLEVKQVVQTLQSDQIINGMYTHMYLSIINSFKQISLLLADKSSFFLKVLWSLHYFLWPTKKFMRKTVDGKKDFGRFSIKNSQESFIYINETMQSVMDHIDFLVKKNEPIQPFILGIGTPKNFTVFKYYVYLDAQLLECNDIYRAFDLCFKTFHIFDVEYPVACNNFWTFAEKFLFEINLTGSTKNGKVCLLISELESK